MIDLMAVSPEVNHLIVSIIEEISEQKSKKEDIHPIDDNGHIGQGFDSVKTFSVTRRFLSLSMMR